MRRKSTAKVRGQVRSVQSSIRLLVQVAGVLSINWPIIGFSIFYLTFEHLTLIDFGILKTYSVNIIDGFSFVDFLI